MMILVDKTTIEHGLGKLVEHVRCFVQPAALMTRRRQRLVEGVPKAKRAIADGQLRRDRAFKSTSNSLQLCALSRMPVWKPISSLTPSGVAPIKTNMHVWMPPFAQDVFERLGPRDRMRSCIRPSDAV
jgi:hypothetical protein